MDYDVTFHGVTSRIAINPSISLKQVRFIPKSTAGTVNRANNTAYPDIGSMQVFCHLDQAPEETRSPQEQLEVALYIAEEIITGLVATTQEEFYLEKPIKCTYEGKKYVLEDGFWQEIMPGVQTIYGSEAFVDNLDFIDEPRNFHPMYHFYRVAKDESYMRDYRALNLWRFFEAYFGKQGGVLKAELVSLGMNRGQVNDFYHNIRCAVAHAKDLHKNPEADNVILPKSYETESNGRFMIDLLDMIKLADKIVKAAKPQPTDIQR